MLPHIDIINQILPDQSVICIIGSDELPEWLSLSSSEISYVKRCLADKEELICVNSYFKLSIIIREKDEANVYTRHEKLRRTAVLAAELIKKHKKTAFTICSYQSDKNAISVFAEGLVLGVYSFSKYKEKSMEDDLSIYPQNISLYGDIDKKDIEWLSAIWGSVYFARDMVNEPLSHLNTEIFAEKIFEFGEAAGLKVENYGKKKIESLKMSGLIAVNKGSVDPPAFSILEWKPENPINSKPVILVGKGVVFDTGGINLKPGSSLDDMKSDMAGGAVVAAVLAAIARTKLNIHLIGLIPITDNRPGLNAIVPGDIISMENGKTVEVLNTDAEGRLILADALIYADNYDPSLVISVATLTGSAENAFGNQAIAAMGNAGDDIFRILREAGYEVHERIAEMPFFSEYGEMMKSDIADLKNIGGKKAGAITAGKFLENFTISPFIHLDIAGTAMFDKKEFYHPKGGTGYGVRLLAGFLKQLVNGNNKL